MGNEAICTGRLAGRSSPGTAKLETDYVLFRGEFRTKLPFKELTGVEAQDGWLLLGHPDGELALELGVQAAKWADKIRNPKSRLDKLGAKAGQRIALVGITSAAFQAELAARVADVRAGDPRPESDLIFLQVDEPAGLARIAALVSALQPAGALWVISPKGRKDLRDVDIMAAGRAAGLVDVKGVAYDQIYTALKFVIPQSERKK
jgi:hypothetical protein